MDTAPANDATSTDPLRAEAEQDCTAEGSTGIEPGYGTLADPLCHELWQKSGAGAVGVTAAEFGAALKAIGARHNFGLESGRPASTEVQEAFWRALCLEDLALAVGCALGRDTAWQQFMARYRGPLIRAAQGLTRSAALGEELADALYGELFGFVEREGARRSPLERYSGRGSLMSWLRAMMAQQHVNQYRKTHRETALEDIEPAAPESADPEPEVLGRLREALPVALAGLNLEERFLLSAYYLDGHSLAEVGRVLGVHEATVSRKLKRVTKHVRKELLRALTASGLSRRAAEEALGTDPRDVDVNWRKLLQNPADKAYSIQEGQA